MRRFKRYAVRTLVGLSILAVFGCQNWLGDKAPGDSPSSYLAVAAYLDDGHATVLLQPCPQDYVASIELMQSDPVTPGPSPFDHPFENPGVWRLEGLRSLPDGQVWIGFGGTITRQEFSSAASTFCANPGRVGVYPS